MSRFVNTTATRTVDLGPCECPGTPHARDEALVRAEMSNQDILDFANSEDGEETAEAVANLTIGWNLLGDDGKPCPPTKEAVLALFTPTLRSLIKGIGESVKESSARGTDPKASFDPSRSGTPASGRHTRKTALPA